MIIRETIEREYEPSSPFPFLALSAGLFGIICGVWPRVLETVIDIGLLIIWSVL